MGVAVATVTRLIAPEAALAGAKNPPCPLLALSGMRPFKGISGPAPPSLTVIPADVLSLSHYADTGSCPWLAGRQHAHLVPMCRLCLDGEETYRT